MCWAHTIEDHAWGIMTVTEVKSVHKNKRKWCTILFAYPTSEATWWYVCIFHMLQLLAYHWIFFCNGHTAFFKWAIINGWSKPELLIIIIFLLFFIDRKRTFFSSIRILKSIKSYFLTMVSLNKYGCFISEGNTNQTK